MSEMPEPWRTWMEQRELEPTYRRLARETDLGVETVRQAIVGKGRRPSAETVRRLAVVLHRSPNELDQLWGYK
ncbi:MAG: helix-turn-helix transcriptional regulator, partial [Sinomonas sp.]|nr:helix-turn-helix transcriptional regulator [Sinomonas sp.]